MMNSTDSTNCISEVHFGIWSSEDILKASAAEITSAKLTGDPEGTVYDPRLGSMDPHKNCPTCGLNSKECPGHFGHINLARPLVHPLEYKHVLQLLRVLCFSCNQLLITKELLEMQKILKLKGRKRFERICKNCEKVQICMHCKAYQPKIQFSTTESTYHMLYSDKTKIPMSASDISRCFSNMDDELVSLLGFDPKMVHPKSLIIKTLPVLPPVDRPWVTADGMMCDDDLTIQYVEICKINAHLSKPETPQNKIAKYWQSLKFRVKSLFDNSQNKAKHTNGRPFKCIKKRIAGKDGIVRGNLMGKRVEQAARTVIGADPTLPTGVLGIPPYVAKTLSVDTHVNKYNIHQIQNLVDSGKCNTVTRGKSRINLQYATRKLGTPIRVNDIILRGSKRITITPEDSHFKLIKGDIIEREGKRIPTVEEKQKVFSLQIGDKVARQLQDGDIVLFNRQPTLHQGSMIAHRVRILPGKTFRFNLATTSPFNADFDGDEMNIHVPQDLRARVELMELSDPEHLLVSAQSGKTNIKIVQDSLSAAYLMSCDNRLMPKHQFFQLCACCKGENWEKTSWILQKIRKISRVMKNKDIPGPYSGRGLISMILPGDFFYRKKNNAVPDEPFVVIEQGVMIEGALTKSDLKGGHNSILRRIAKEYSARKALEIIDNIQFVTNNWLLYEGFSVGIKDCIATNKEAISEAVERYMLEADIAEKTTANPLIREAKINAALSKARDIGLRMAKNALTPENNFVKTVTSGSKGDYFNIGQIGGIMGQQNFSGARIKPYLNHGKRPTVHYPFGDLPQDVRYESKGFVRGNFLEGLSPAQTWFHAITGREGVTDTAMKTAKTGYIQRKLVKVAEDLAVKQDGTVRNANGHVVQFVYGEDGLDPKETILVNKKPAIMNIKNLATQLNHKYSTRDRIRKKWISITQKLIEFAPSSSEKSSDEESESDISSHEDIEDSDDVSEDPIEEESDISESDDSDKSSNSSADSSSDDSGIDSEDYSELEDEDDEFYEDWD